MPDFTPNYSYIYGPPEHRTGAANNALINASAAMERSATTIQTAVMNLTRGMQGMVTSSATAAGRAGQMINTVFQPSAPGAQAFIPGIGFTNVRQPSVAEMILNPNPTGLFAQLTGVGLEQRGPGWAYGGTNPVVERQRAFALQQARSRFGANVGLRAGAGALDIATFLSGNPLLFPAAALLGGAADLNTGISRIETATMTASAAALPPMMTGTAAGGLNMRQVRDVGKAVRDMWKSQMDLSLGDMEAMYQMAIRGGWFNRVRNAQQWIPEMKNYFRLAKEVSGVLDKTMMESTQIINNLSQAGIEGARNVRRVLYSADVVARRTGQETMSVLTQGIGLGQQLHRGIGMAMPEAAMTGIQFTAGAAATYRTGTEMQRQYISSRGGPEQMAMTAGQGLGQAYQSPLMQMVFAKAFSVTSQGVTNRYRPGMGLDVMNLPTGINPVQFAAMQDVMPLYIKEAGPMIRDIASGLLKKTGIRDPYSGLLFLESAMQIPRDQLRALLQSTGEGGIASPLDEYMREAEVTKNISEAERGKKTSSVLARLAAPALRGIRGIEAGISQFTYTSNESAVVEATKARGDLASARAISGTSATIIGSDMPEGMKKEALREFNRTAGRYNINSEQVNKVYAFNRTLKKHMWREAFNVERGGDVARAALSGSGMRPEELAAAAAGVSRAQSEIFEYVWGKYIAPVTKTVKADVESARARGLSDEFVDKEVQKLTARFADIKDPREREKMLDRWATTSGYDVDQQAKIMLRFKEGSGIHNVRAIATAIKDERRESTIESVGARLGLTRQELSAWSQITSLGKFRRGGKGKGEIQLDEGGWITMDATTQEGADTAIDIARSMKLDVQRGEGKSVRLRPVRSGRWQSREVEWEKVPDMLRGIRTLESLQGRFGAQDLGDFLSEKYGAETFALLHGDIGRLPKNIQEKFANIAAQKKIDLKHMNATQGIEIANEYARQEEASSKDNLINQIAMAGLKEDIGSMTVKHMTVTSMTPAAK